MRARRGGVETELRRDEGTEGTTTARVLGTPRRSLAHGVPSSRRSSTPENESGCAETKAIISVFRPDFASSPIFRRARRERARRASMRSQWTSSNSKCKAFIPRGEFCRLGPFGRSAVRCKIRVGR